MAGRLLEILDDKMLCVFGSYSMCVWDLVNKCLKYGSASVSTVVETSSPRDIWRVWVVDEIILLTLTDEDDVNGGIEVSFSLRHSCIEQQQVLNTLLFQRNKLHPFILHQAMVRKMNGVCVKTHSQKHANESCLQLMSCDSRARHTRRHIHSGERLIGWPQDESSERFNHIPGSIKWVWIYVAH